ncbi:unnamed protein product, partial [Didymodactylos carnosus]
YPFMKTAIDYLRQVYPPPLKSGQTDGEKLLVFLLGIAAHQISDAVWHGSLTGCPNGFIDANAWSDFYGDRNQAHSSADLGGDSVADYELPIGYIGLVDNWYTPTQHLQMIYRQYANIFHSPTELNATAERVQACSTLTFIQRFLANLFLGKAYSHYSKTNTLLLDEFYNYYYGGIENMVRETLRYWDIIIDMYEYGTDICTNGNRNPYYLNCTNNFQRQISYLEQKQSISYIRTVTHGTRLPFTSQTLPLAKKLEYTEIDRGLISDQSYANFGHSSLIADFNNDGIDDLVVSAPNYYIYGCAQGGRVFIIYGRDEQPIIPERHISVIEQLANQTLISPSCDGDRFGTSLTIIDWNNDSYNDLVVSSPSRGFGFIGSIFIYAGSESGLQSLPYLQIDGINEHDSIGWNVQSTHFDDDNILDLLITSPYAQKNGYDEPQRGVVWIFLSSRQEQMAHSEYIHLTVKDATYTIWGEISKSKFGYSTTIVPSSCTTDKQPILLISAPNYASPNTLQSQGVGKIYAYTINDTGPQLTFTLSGNNMDHFGHSLSISQQHCVLAVGAPTRSTSKINKEWTGAVILLSFAELLTKSIYKRESLSVNAVSVLATIVGELRFQRLGWAVEWSTTFDLCITAPLGTSLLSSEGRTYIIKGERIPLKPTSDPISITKLSSKTFVAHDRMNRFGTHLNLLSSPLSNSTYLAISSPLTASKQDNIRLPGTLYIYKF